MHREIEKDGFITREADLAPRKRICYTCRHYQHDPTQRRYVCLEGHKVGEEDWRFKYDVCDEWEKDE